MGKFTVYGLAFATCTRRVLMTLEELGASYELKPVDVIGGENKRPEFLERHPFGQIPVFYDDDFKIFESRAICRYLADVVKGPVELLPKDPKQRALVEQWISVESSNYVPEKLVNELVFKKWRGIEADEKVVAESKKKLPEVFAILNKHLEGRNFMVGDNLTIAGTLIG
jgi:glutathione S-transferase